MKGLLLTLWGNRELILMDVREGLQHPKKK